MPTLNVARVLFSPEFCDYVTVTRRFQTVNGHGEVGVTTQTFANIPVVITSAPPNELERPEDEQYQPRTFTIITTFRLTGASTTTQPDIVSYLGGMYIVNQVEPYTRYGSGVVQCRMTSVDTTDVLLEDYGPPPGLLITADSAAITADSGTITADNGPGPASITADSALPTSDTTTVTADHA